MGAAILMLNLLKILQSHIAKKQGLTTSDKISLIHLMSAAFGLAVFFLGAFWLESSSAPPGSVYEPAAIENGSVKSGGFE